MPASEARTPDGEVRACAYVYNLGSYRNPPEPCDLDAEPDSEYCARHRVAVDGYDNSDEPYWMED